MPSSDFGIEFRRVAGTASRPLSSIADKAGPEYIPESATATPLVPNKLFLLDQGKAPHSAKSTSQSAYSLTTHGRRVK